METGQKIDSRLFRYGKACYGQPLKTISVKCLGTEVAFTFGPFDMPVIREDVLALIESTAKVGYEFFSVEVVGSNSRFWVMTVTT